VAQLEYEINKLKWALEAAVAAEEKCQRRTHGSRSRVREIENDLYNKQSELKDAEKAPPAVWQPLPATESLALQVLFFQSMPPLFLRRRLVI
jgi:hypothetical protein